MRVLGAALVATSLLLSGCTGADDGTALPDVTVTGFGDDQPVDVASLRGPMVLNLWATWCKPCRTEMPVLEDFHQQHGDAVEVVGVDYLDPTHDEARRLVDDTGVTYRLLADPLGDLNGAAPLPNVQGLPLTVLVDADGQVAYMEYGVIESVDQLEDLVDEHLGVDL